MSKKPYDEFDDCVSFETVMLEVFKSIIASGEYADHNWHDKADISAEAAIAFITTCSRIQSRMGPKKGTS